MKIDFRAKTKKRLHICVFRDISTVSRSISFIFSLTYNAPYAILALSAGVPLLGEKFFAYASLIYSYGVSSACFTQRLSADSFPNGVINLSNISLTIMANGIT